MYALIICTGNTCVVYMYIYLMMPTHSIYLYSGFDPMYAPLWTVKTHLVDNPGLILSNLMCSYILSYVHLHWIFLSDDLVHDFTKLCYRQESIEDLLGNKLMREDMRSPGKLNPPLLRRPLYRVFVRSIHRCR